MYTYRFKGVDYQGPTDLHAETGIPVRTARWHMKKHGDLSRLENLYKSPAQARSRYRQPTKLLVEGVEFDSLRDLAEKTGVAKETVRRWHATTQTIHQAVKAYKRKNEK